MFFLFPGGYCTWQPCGFHCGTFLWITTSYDDYMGSPGAGSSHPRLWEANKEESPWPKILQDKIIKTSTFWKTKKYLWNLFVWISNKGFQNSTDFGVKQPPIIYPFIKPFIGAPCHSFHLFTKSSRRVHLVGIAEVFLCSSSLVVSLCLRNLAWKRRAWE